MRAFIYNLLVPLKYIRNAKSINSRHLAPAITGDHVTELDGKTLTGRLLNYLDNCNNVPKHSENSLEIQKILRQNDVSNLRKCSVEQILSTFSSVSNPEYCRSKTDFFMILDLLDFELCRRLSELETKEIFNVLHNYMNIIPHRIVQYKFYENAMEKLFNRCGMLSKDGITQLIFFLGLNKKSTRSQYMLRKCINLLNEDSINDLSIEELCIICNSTFKTSTKINNVLFLNKIVSYLNGNLHILKDPALFITLVKTLRHNRYQSEELLATISCTIFFNKTIDCYSFSALCHILALYSDFLYYDTRLIKSFAERCIELLKDNKYLSKHTHMQEQARAKDIKRFLWCLSNLNYKELSIKDIKDVIVPNIINRITIGELKDDFESITEIALYLWMLNFRDYEIIIHALSKQNVQYIRGITTSTKDRLNLLLTCIYYEDPDLYRKINTQPQKNIKYDITYQLTKRKELDRIFEILKTIPAKFEINKYTLDCQVPYINIIGITGYKKKIYKAVNIEILDDYTCMKNTDSIPSGLMQLKLRIMEKFDEGIIVIRADEVESMSNEDLSNLLEDELDLVC